MFLQIKKRPKYTVILNTFPRCPLISDLYYTTNSPGLSTTFPTYVVNNTLISFKLLIKGDFKLLSSGEGGTIILIPSRAIYP